MSELLQAKDSRALAFRHGSPWYAEWVALPDAAIFAPSNHEMGGVGNGESRAAESGVTPADSPRAATDPSSGRGEDD